MADYLNVLDGTTIDNAGALSDSTYNFDPNYTGFVTTDNGLNSSAGNGGSILEDIWDEGKNVFNTVLSAGAEAYKANALANLETTRTNNQIAQNAALHPPYTAQQRLTISVAAIGAIVMLGAAFVLMTRRRGR